MTIQVPIFGNQLGLNHDGVLVGNPHAGLAGYTEEVMYNPMGVAKVTVTSAELLALNATPKTVLAAAPAGFANVFMGAALHKPAGTAYADIAAGDDLVFKATDASGAQVSSVIEATGFLDSTAVQSRYAVPRGATGATAADQIMSTALLVLHMLTGEVTTGTGGLVVWVYFRRIPLVLTA